jgi:hypothetical protein
MKTLVNDDHVVWLPILPEARLVYIITGILLVNGAPVAIVAETPPVRFRILADSDTIHLRDDIIVYSVFKVFPTPFPTETIG